MNHTIKRLGLKALVLLTVLLIGLNVFPTIIKSQSSQEIGDEISKKNDELAQTQAEIEKLKAEIENGQSTIENAKDGLPKIEAQIKDVQNQVELTNKKLELLKQQNELKELTKKKLVKDQDSALLSSYQDWRISQDSFSQEANLDDPKLRHMGLFFDETLFGIRKGQIDFVAQELQQLDKEIDESDQLKLDLEKQQQDLEKQKVDLENQIAYLNSLIANNSNSLTSVLSQQEEIQKNIGSLLIVQQNAAQREAEILNNSPPVVTPVPTTTPTPDPINPTPTPVQEPRFVFTGRGRDLYQGHGVGMSQWGAYGAALAGWSASQILTYYYTNTRVEARSGQSINVQGYGNMDINTYAAGIGEVPSKACGNAQQAAARPDKYVNDNGGTVWDCWPEESIKAQVIAARSYALRYGGTICTTAACQVYDGGNAKQWAADETRDQVVVSNGPTQTNQVIVAYYSADNSQGYGTANNDTVFQNFSGDAEQISYLRAVNDTGVAATTYYTGWTYQTLPYTMAGIKEMLNFTAYNGASTADESDKNNVRNLLNGFGTLASINFERDPSQRVKRVTFGDTNGVQRYMGGWWFKVLWVNWQYDIGQYDYIYSQSFYLNAI